jgi:hypothetical protein
MKIVTKQKEYTYIPLIERAEEKPFTVTFKRLDNKTFAKIEDNLTKFTNGGEEAFIQSGTFAYQVFKNAVTGWKNLFDENDKEIKPKFNQAGQLLDESINLLPADIVAEVAQIIVSVTKDPLNAESYLS